jgi:hypothetical protein
MIQIRDNQHRNIDEIALDHYEKIKPLLVYRIKRYIKDEQVKKYIEKSLRDIIIAKPNKLIEINKNFFDQGKNFQNLEKNNNTHISICHF